LFKSYTCFAPCTSLIPAEHKYEQIRDDEVEVKVDFCGVCHTDLAFAIRNGLGLGTFPHTPGHEVIGRIVKVGGNVDQKRIGQRVGVGFFKRSCHSESCVKCSEGDDNLCPIAEPVLATNGAHGGFGEIVRCEDKWAIPIPEGLDPAAAAPLLCGGCTVWSPIDRFNLKGKKVGLLGLGGLGHLFCKFCTALDNEIWVFSHSKEEKAEDAARFGVREIIDVNDKERKDQLKETLDFLLVTSYEDLDWSPFIEIIKPGGTMCWVGWVHLPISIAPFPLIWKQRSIVGSNVASSKQIADMLDFCVKHNIVADAEIHSMQEINGVLNKFIKQGFKYRAVLTAGPVELADEEGLPSMLDAALKATGDYAVNTAHSAVERMKEVPDMAKSAASAVATGAHQVAQFAKQIVLGEHAGAKSAQELSSPLKPGETAFKSFTCFAPGTSLVPAVHKYGPLKDDEVEIKVDFCGLCHTDLAVGIRNAAGVAEYPHTPGHEIIGRIQKVGANVDQKRIGERVGLGFITRSCRSCELCQQGDDHLCPNARQVMALNGAHGGFSEIVRCEDRWAIPIPESLESAPAAPLLCAGCTVWSPIDRFNLKGKKVGLMGLGGLGHLFCKFCKALDNEIWVFSHSKEQKEDDAKRFGATEIIDIHDSDRLWQMREKLDFLCITLYKDVDWDSYIDVLKPGGIMCFLGLVHLPVAIGVYPLIWKQRSVVGSCFASSQQIRDMLDFCAKHDIVAEIEQHPMQEINGALNKFIKEGMEYRAVLTAGPIELGTGEGYPTAAEAYAAAAKEKVVDRATSVVESVKSIPDKVKQMASAVGGGMKSTALTGSEVVSQRTL